MEIAILIPCYNEALTIGNVIDDFKHELPKAKIYIYDNNSRDDTAIIAKAHGAIVRRENRQGKGFVVRSMFRDIDADCYVMVDGDHTYPAPFVHQLIKPIESNEASMVIGDRLSNGSYTKENKRKFHNFGNSLVRRCINLLYKSDVHDIMTGYRAFNRLFVKSMPVMSPGFEIETEMSLHALDKRFPIKEIPIDYRDRPDGSESKLNTLGDGFKVLIKIFSLFKEYRPFLFFGLFSFLFLVLGLLVGLPVILEFIQTSYITKVPSAILATGLITIAMLTFSCGLILDTVISSNKKNYELELNRIIESCEGYQNE
ncbi:glycosyltransferase family 2 protein [Paraliobacillus sediminis]|uniref:glycosyltransferase family 2 protein n=1 Tax=Paraliobacillus sediminis TaxID=1885916 RepID=UPI000E3D0747|nr:glycosyltransferase family 2 protein [Paraliobacillus sediminis]